MKRIFKSSETPPILKKFIKYNPNEKWERFRRAGRKGYRQVKEQLLKDQHGLCAYCEISIRLADDEESVDDFRVEHFHPKGETDFKVHNYHLDWQNLLGVCHGGSQPNVEEAKWRFSRRKRDRSCDVPKGGKPINEYILNPLEIPADTRLFKYAEINGKMFVDEETCPQELVEKAKNSIRELNLNAPRLMRMRKTVIDVLQEEIEVSLLSGMEIEEVAKVLAETFLLPDDQGNYQDFFTVIRWFLGDVAEDVLREKNYMF